MRYVTGNQGDGIADDPVVGMTTNTHRRRLAVGIFRDTATRENALRELRSGGFATDQLAVVAGKETLAKAGWSLVGPAEREDSGLESRRFTEIGVSGKAGPLLASDGDLSQLFIDWANTTGRGVHCVLDPWLDQAHARFLQRQLDAGAITLWVRITDGDDELRACRILLRTSADRVQVHDIAGAL